MYSQALNLFYRLFFVPRALTTDEEDSQTKQLQEIQMRLRASLGDYAKFLHAKSLNNLTLTSYPFTFLKLDLMGCPVCLIDSALQCMAYCMTDCIIARLIDQPYCVVV